LSPGREAFQASRLTRGNRLFPTQLVIDEHSLVRRKRDWLKVDEVSMHLSRIASVRIETGILFADIRIESSGGDDDIVSHGHGKGDARRIKERIERWQTENLGRRDDRKDVSVREDG
jgi:hypothetical protein